MAGEFDSIGEAVTGGLVAGAVEPEAGRSPGHTDETHCLNCRAPLTGAYCVRCGQKAHIHRTIGAFFDDLAHGVLHFDGKTWRTLPLLAWHPGKLTRRYIDGQRARFVSPMALFLFSVFVMFALLNVTLDSEGVSAPQIRSDIQQSITRTQEQIRALESQRSALPPGPRRLAIDARLAEARDDLKDLNSLEALRTTDGAKVNLSSDIAFLQKPLQRAMRNPDLLIYKIRTSAYKWSWALIPISAPFLWLLFPFSRRFKMYDHVVFVTYSLAFMNLLVVAAILLYLGGLPGVAGAALFVPPLHFYRQLKECYGLSRFGALWRTALLTVFAMVGLTLFAILMLTVGVL